MEKRYTNIGGLRPGNHYLIYRNGEVVLGVAGIVFRKTYTVGTISMRFGVYADRTHSITLLVTRCFYNLPTNLGIIMIGHNVNGFSMTTLTSTEGIYFSFEAASDDSDELNGIVTVTQNNAGNALGTLCITVLQRTSNARFTGEITGS